MANNKLYGYTPDPSKQKREEGSTEINNRLDRFNPYEFRKGMDYELTSIGCARLAESTIEEREKSTETVLKNLEEHQAYYSALIQYTTGMNQAGKIDKITFKKYLEENFPNTAGTGMQCVKKEFKNDKMTDVKPNDINTIKMKTVQPLKEAIKREIKNILEAKGEDVYDMDLDTEPTKKAVKSTDKDTTVSVAKNIADLQKELEGTELKGMRSNLAKLEAERKKIFDKFTPFPEDAGAKAKAHKAYADAVRSKSKEISTQKEKIDTKESQIEADIEKLTSSLTTLQHEEKIDRREVATTMMEKDTHLALLEIIKEAGVNMMEGAHGVKIHYEIAKESYKEGFMAALDKSKKEKKEKK